MSLDTDVVGRAWLPAFLAIFLISLFPVEGIAAIPYGKLPPGLQPMEDGEMAGVVGQALIVTNKIQGNGGINGTSGLTFYNVGLDAELRLNLNIDRLELGRTGGTPGMADGHVDILARHVMFGCTANAAGNCVDSSMATQLRDFVFNRPFFQFAIENDDQPAHRRVVGLRLGAEQAEGPMSIGEFQVFSGYLSATANIAMQAQNNIAITCGPGENCAGTAQSHSCFLNLCWLLGGRPNSNGRNEFGYHAPGQSLGLKDDHACFIGQCASFSQLTVNYGGVNRFALPVIAQGNRQSQAFISNLFLSSAVDQIVQSMSVNQSSGLPSGLVNLILPAISGSASNSIKQQLASNLGVPVGQLDGYQMPYNISNLHQVYVDSDLFGLSFQERAIRYPGYVADVPRGWGMYMPDAFELNITSPISTLVNNIANTSAASGNIVNLDPVLDNCWGSATFC